MGYATTYRLECDVPGAGGRRLLKEIICDNENMSYALESDGSTCQSCKWYDNEDDMRNVSKKHPGVLFTLSGEGEEAGDIWRKYFRDGKMQQVDAIWAFESFDPDKLA